MKGIKKSEEHKKKLSKSREKYKGKNHPLYGVKRSKETKEKQSKSMIGKPCWCKGTKGLIKHTEESKRKLSIAMSGENHPNWKGGISMKPYCVEFTIEFKNYIKDRDNLECQNPLCNKKTLSLCVHHIDYIKQNCDPDNLITVCLGCNSQANFDREWHELFYKEIIRRKNGN